METTITSGTCKKAFRGLKKDKILSRLNIGGKSGSIDNESHDTRYDWFVGFAEEKEGSAKIVISAMVAHEKYIGVRASEYARMAIKEYFREHFANNQKSGKKESRYARLRNIR
jgi:DNA-binding transcriptional regulator YhcF (GntR family)